MSTNRARQSTAASLPLLLSWSIVGAVVVAICVLGTLCFTNAVQWIDRPFPGFLVNERLVVGNFGRYEWTGAQAGLRYPDKVRKINDTAVASAQEVQAIVQRSSVGEPLRYEIERNGTVIEVSVATMQFGRADFVLTFGLLFFPGAVYLALGLLVFVLKPYTRVSGLFFSTCALLTVYALLSFDIQSAHSAFLGLYLLVFALFPATFVHLSLLFPEQKAVIERRPVVQLLPYVCSLGLFGATDLLYPRPAFALFYQALHLYAILSAGFVVVAMLHAYMTTLSMAAKQRARVIVLGAVLALLLPAVVLYLSFFAGFALPNNFLALPILIFPASIAYAMVKHNLFDIDVFVRRTCGYVLSTGAIVGAYALLLSGLETGLRWSQLSTSPVFSLLFSLGAVFLFSPLHRRMQHFVDRAFYRQQYDYRKTLREVSEAMTGLLDAPLIHQTLLGTVTREMFLENGLLLLPEPARRGYSVYAFAGQEDRALTAVHVDGEDPAVRLLQEQNEALLRYDLDVQSALTPEQEALQHTFEVLASELLLPMKYKDELRGVLSLGRKKSGQMFTLEDLDLLRTVTNQATVALENARLFQEHVEKSRLEEELELARGIQSRMLPKQPPSIAGLAIAAVSLPAREVGGDFYDFLPIDATDHGNGRLGVLVGDVSGKAVSGALVMAASLSVLRVLVEADATVEEVLHRANQRLCRDVQKGMFVALLYAVIDVERQLLAFANAGLTQPILCRATEAAPRYLEADGDTFPLGIVKNSVYRTTQVPLESGDLLVFYSDGVLEAMNAKGELFGFDRLLVSVAEGRRLGPAALLEKLRADVARYVGTAEQHDDVTIVVLKVDDMDAARPEAS
ncbi:MAG: SpoIIE family protein phosphatase [Deltaproteobacteria bacterium]|nr:SpoIIE family protein phosphatase [Deltaproteobacteria bacterium]